MDKLPPILSGFTGAAGRFAGIAGQILQDRLELLSLELREAKIRYVQVLILACIGVSFFMLGLLLLTLAGVYVLPPEWRFYGLAAAAGASLLAGALILMIMRRRLKRKQLAFDQSLAELKKDTACFLTGN